MIEDKKRMIYMTSEERCPICGEIIPEGRQLCPSCDYKSRIGEQNERASKNTQTDRTRCSEIHGRAHQVRTTKKSPRKIQSAGILSNMQRRSKRRQKEDGRR